MLVLPESWKAAWQGKDIFNQIFALEGSIYKEKDNRKTLSFTFNNKLYFAKLHKGLDWKKILKYIFLQFRLPVLGAQNEWKAIQRLEQLNIKTTPLVGYGKQGWNPVRIRSFIITQALTDTLSLEKFCENWPAAPPEPAVKRALINEIAVIARALHENAVNHRDFYICHFLLKTPQEGEKLDPENLSVYLIDLHRVQQRRRLSRRWQVKDIAGLYFSSMDIGLTKRDIFRFMRAYGNKPLRVTMDKDEVFWGLVEKRGRALYGAFS
jgi:heptose I phosphotransferase